MVDKVLQKGEGVTHDIWKDDDGAGEGEDGGGDGDGDGDGDVEVAPV